MPIVRLNDWNEFLTELTTNAPEDKVVRLTLSLRYDAGGQGFITLVAGYLDRGGIVEFVHYLGPAPQPDENESKTIQEPHYRGKPYVRHTGTPEHLALLNTHRAELTALGWTVRPGRYHMAPTQR